MTKEKFFCSTDNNYGESESFINAEKESLFKEHKRRIEMLKSESLDGSEPYAPMPDEKLSHSPMPDEDEPYTPMPIYKIPIVFHVVYHDAVEKIGKTQILDQLDSLNKDFGNKNLDNILFDKFPREKSCAADSKIEFILANRDPNGDATEGITETCTDIECFKAPDDASHRIPLEQQPVKSTRLKGKDAWDTRKYLNVWICRLSDPCGYAQYPFDTVTQDQRLTDGIVIDYRCFGSGETTLRHRNKGKTLTHEIGHWLGIYHLWGTGKDGSGCNQAGDDLDDTPPQMGPQTGKPNGYSSNKQCPGCEPPMVLNFMDEWDDECSLMFTRDQVWSMRDWLKELRGSVIT